MAKVGFRFHPTDYELIYYYLMNQIIGNTKQVEETISEINFYDYDPVSLPSSSKNQSENGIYYFFAPKQYTNSKKRLRKRSSEYGKWKLSGEVTEIKDKISGETIGDKKVLVYEKNGAPKAKGTKSPWVMHEYQITHSQYQHTYVICKLFDKREETQSPYGNNSIEPTQSLVSDLNTVREISTFPEIEQSGQDQIDDMSMNDFNIPNVQLQTPYLSQAHDEFLSGLKHVNRGEVEQLFYDQDLTMQESYMPTNPVRLEQPYHENSYGMFVNDFTLPMNAQENQSLCYGFDPNMQLRSPYLSQGYDESISAMSHQGTWSPVVDSIGSSNIHFPSCSSSDSCKATFADLCNQ